MPTAAATASDEPPVAEAGEQGQPDQQDDLHDAVDDPGDGAGRQRRHAQVEGDGLAGDERPAHERPGHQAGSFWLPASCGTRAPSSSVTVPGAPGSGS